MSSSRQLSPISPFAGIFLALTFNVAVPLVARAQTPQPAPEAQVTTQAAEQPASTPNPAAAEAEAVQQRLSRARALAAIGRLAAAAAELENMRSTTKDEAVRDVARLLLMAIFVEMPDYPRAAALLEEAFKARPAQSRTGDAATHFYFALAGQTVNAVRTHLERYRAFGVNVADASELPSEAAGDVDQVRVLLERVVEQARALHAEQLKGGADGVRGLDAAALLEDAATVRMRIARGDQDRARWQAEVSEARQHLFSETRVASISPIPAARPAPPPASTASKTPAPAASPNNTQRTTAQPSGEPRTNAAPANAQPPAQQPDDAAAPAGRADNSPVAIGSLAGKAKSRSTPTYPPLARTARVTGTVTVFLVVNAKGEVESVVRADGPQQLQQAAIEAARRWKFNQTVIDGQPVRVTGYLNFNFTL
ncbi:MAG: energy transducer TonB [Pyrinomonadaceae bacterium]